MNLLYSYFNYLWSSDNKVIEEKQINLPLPKKFIITSDDLLKVNLHPQKDVIPAPSRNMPVIDTFELNIYNKAQLQELLSIKLKPTKINEKPVYYPPRHPVVKQLNEKFGIGIKT
jgi:hypothetical protein